MCILFLTICLLSFFFFFFCVCTNKNSKLFKKKFNSKFMNIYEKEIYSNLTLTIEHFTFYKKKIYVFNLGI